MTDRRPPKALNKSASDIAVNARIERARKATSKAALKAELAAQNAATFGAPTQPDPAVVAAQQVQAEETRKERAKADHAAALVTAQADADATGVTLEEMLAEMGIDAEGAPLVTERSKLPYDGPMVALKAARRSYVKAANGIQCNGDGLATLCGARTREQTVRALIAAMGLGSNPYTHLNPGQQSMNLRNKARHQVNIGILTFAQIEAAFDPRP